MSDKPKDLYDSYQRHVANEGMIRKRNETIVENWNDAYPPGTSVIVELDSGEKRETTTRSWAEVLSGHTPVVWLEGVTGCYILDRVTPNV